MLRVLRRVGIAFGCIVAAWLAVSLVAGVVLGSAASGNAIVWLITLLLGGLIYRDIIRRDQRSA
ncbi:MAG TPA: hypothetical protein VEO91_07140 [Candidatus Limnocylindria bacterium]|nr:hypothetical protein [Candidatus Limnocylindria bacterium]